MRGACFAHATTTTKFQFCQTPTTTNDKQKQLEAPTFPAVTPDCGEKSLLLRTKVRNFRSRPADASLLSPHNVRRLKPTTIVRRFGAKPKIYPAGCRVTHVFASQNHNKNLSRSSIESVAHLSPFFTSRGLDIRHKHKTFKKEVAHLPQGEIDLRFSQNMETTSLSEPSLKRMEGAPIPF